MSQLSAFVGHSFTEEDQQVIETILKYLDQVKNLNIGFSWQSAEPAEPKELADKVKALIHDKNLFIGICTRKEYAIEPAAIKNGFLNKKRFNAADGDFVWKTSDWIVQEIGLAIGRGMDLILMVENGVRRPGGLQGNLEYIAFDRNRPEKSFGKLLEMIQALLPKAKTVTAHDSENKEVAEEKPIAQENISKDWLTPREDWTRSNYEFVLFHSIFVEDREAENNLTSAYFASKDGSSQINRESWEALGEYYRIQNGKGGKLSKLEELTKKYHENIEIKTYLARSYRQYGEFNKAATEFCIAASGTDEKKRRLAINGEGVICLFRAGLIQDAENTLAAMRELATEVDDGETLLIKTLREVAKLQNAKELLFGLTERLLQLDPDDMESRFSLAYDYSNEDLNSLSLFHYLKISASERREGAWNNLAVQLDRFDLPFKSVSAYRRAESLGNTLAMSNLANKFMKGGFLLEAEELCKRALSNQDFHRNVGLSISKIKQIPEEEAKKETKLLAEAKIVSDFYREFGFAATRKPIDQIAARWKGPDCELQISISGRKINAEGEYNLPHPSTGLGLALLGLPSLETVPQGDRYRVSYEGDLFGHAASAYVIRREANNRTQLSLLGEMASRKKTLMIISESLDEIRVYERPESDKSSFYTFARIV